jgi:hypothetical protein
VFLYEPWSQSALACSDQRNGSLDRQTHKGETVPRRSRFPTRAIYQCGRRAHSPILCGLHQSVCSHLVSARDSLSTLDIQARAPLRQIAVALHDSKFRQPEKVFRRIVPLCTANVAGLFSPSSWRSSIRGNPPPIRIRRRPRSPREASG